MSDDDLRELLEKNRLEAFTDKLTDSDIGVTCKADLENVEGENLTQMGMTPIQKNRFRKMVTSLGLRRWESTESMASIAPLQQEPSSSQAQKRPKFCFQESVGYTLKYIVLQHIDRYQEKSIPNLKPDKATMESFKEAILKAEGLQGSQLTCELFTSTGVPLTNDPYLATWTLNQRCIKTNSTICVVLRDSNIGRRGYQMWDDTTRPEQGAEYIMCEISHGESYKVQVNLEKDTPQDVTKKIACLASIPDSVQHLRLPGSSTFAMNCHGTLQNNGINEGDTILIDIQSVDSKSTTWRRNFNCDVQPHVEQTPLGMSTFACFLCVAASELKLQSKKILRLIREHTSWPPLIVALKKIADRRPLIFCEQVAVVEGLYFLFRRILPSREVEDNRVFEHSHLCWAFLLQESNGNNSGAEYKEIDFNCSRCNARLFLPVNIPGKPGEVMCVRDFEKEENEASASGGDEEAGYSANLDMQQLLLCYPIETQSCHVWDPPSNVSMSSRLKVIPRKKLKDLRAIQNKFDKLKIKPPLQLKGGSTTLPLVTLNEFGVPVIFLETNKSAAMAYPLTLYDPVENKLETQDADTLAESTKKYFSSTDEVKGVQSQFTRTPIEAIVVSEIRDNQVVHGASQVPYGEIAVDVSGSMDSNSFAGDASSEDQESTDQTRLTVVQQMFCTFADRSMAYNFQHVIGLVTFNSTPTVTGRLTEYFVEFKAKLEKMRAFGMTAIYDGIGSAIDQFEEIKARFPNCKRRIICLSDGVDTKSTSDPLTIAKKLESEKIVLDAIHIGTENDQTLKGLCHASGGYCFRPANIVEASRLFELETMLSSTSRETRARQQIRTLRDLERLSRTKPYDDHPQHTLPSEVTEPVSNTFSSLRSAADQGQSAVANRPGVFRVMQEMSRIHRKPHPAFKVFPSQNNVCFWRIFMTGPTGTPYENGVFSLFADFPENYPTVPPVVRFINPIHHCNINSVGRICYSIFDRDYSSDITMYKILSAIYGLLMNPEPDDPLDTVVAEQYHTDPTGYDSKAREMTRKHAGKALADCVQGILGRSSDQSTRPPPKHLVCPLTNELFVQPVETPGGYAYERIAIEQHLLTNGTDPQSKEPLTDAELQDATTLRKAADDFRASQAKVNAWWFNR